MKHRLWSVISVLLTVLLLSAPALAAENTRNITEYVRDAAGLLSAEEYAQLNQYAGTVAEEYGFGVYIATVEDFRDYTSGDVFDAATAIYSDENLGKGEGKEGVLLLLSMNDRDFSLITYGDWGNFIFDGFTREVLAEEFLDDFAYNEWYDGFTDYLMAAERQLASGAEKRRSEIGTALIGILVFPAIVAGVAILILGRKMKTVSGAKRASAYLVGGLNLSESVDRYTHTTEIRRRKQTSSSGGGGRVSHRSSGGFSGSKGKF